MKGLTCSLGILSMLMSSVLVLAAESKEDTLASDQTQAQYTRKSITYLGMSVDPSLGVPPDVLQAVEQAIRPQIEIKRFDFNDVDVSKFASIDDFVNALREYVKKRSYDRASADAEMDTRFKEARVYAKDIDRILNSAYFYQMNLFVYRNNPFDCPWNIIEAKALKCQAGKSGMRATVNTTVSFYRANLTDETQAAYSLLRTLQEAPAKGFAAYESPPKPPEPPKLPANATDEQRRRAAEQRRKALEAYQRTLAEYQQRLPQLRQIAGLKAAREAAVGLAMWLNKSMKKIPEFQLKTPVTAALGDGVEFMLGKGEGVRLDDTYDVAEFDVSGKKAIIGYVKVRNIGDAAGSGEGTPSYAEKVKERNRFVGGESLVEHPLVNINFGAHFVTEYMFQEFPFDGQETLAFGAGVFADYDLATTLGWSETYVSIEGDFLFLGSVGLQDDLSLVHAMLGLKKKWYITSLIFMIGVRAGASYFVLEDDTQDDTLVGFGGDVFLGVEYYIKPELSAYFNVAGRFFTNPLTLTGGEVNHEMGVNGALGVRVGF